jgi:hypothetical protein
VTGALRRGRNGSHPESTGAVIPKECRVRLATLFTALMLALAATAPALAETLTLRVQSKHPNVVDVEFYSRTRNLVWPGNKQVYSIKDDDRHSYKLSCQPGETICYGAWVRGNQTVFWGAGPNGKNACRNCCYTCDGGAADVTLNR